MFLLHALLRGHFQGTAVMGKGTTMREFSRAGIYPYVSLRSPLSTHLPQSISHPITRTLVWCSVKDRVLGVILSFCPEGIFRMHRWFQNGTVGGRFQQSCKIGGHNWGTIGGEILEVVHKECVISPLWHPPLSFPVFLRWCDTGSAPVSLWPSLARSS